MFARSSLLALFAVVWLGCASSRPAGSEGDADPTGDGATGDDGSTGGDGSTSDSAAPDGAGGPDGAGPDASAMAIDAAIDANTCSTQPCSLFPQCGCTSPLTCDIDFTDLNGTACRAVNTPGTETSTCASFSECAAGYVCAGGHCLRYCAADTDCAQPRGMCAIQITDQNDQPIAGAITCSSNCNPINSAAGGCPTGQKCGFFTATRAGMDLDILQCTTPGAGAIGAACTSDATCSSNTLCSTYNAQQRCRKVCTRPAGNECATVPGTTCVGFGTPGLVIGGTEYGVCAP